MIANVTTTDRPSPQPSGDPFYLYDGTGMTPAQILAKQVLFGTRYIFAQTGWFSGIRIYTVIGNHYEIYSISDPTGTPIVNKAADFVATIDGWTSIATKSTIVLNGTEVDIIAYVNEPDPTPTVTPLNYNYDTPNNNSAPATGGILHANQTAELMNIHKTDDDAVDRSAFLATLEVGDVIEGLGIRWAIQQIVDNGTYYTFSVSPGTQGTPDGVASFNFETVTATPITYEYEADYNLGNANVRGMYGADTAYGDVVPNNNQYGIDILLQAGTVSTDWDLVANSGGGATGGGSSPSVDWGFVTGDINNQADLQTQFDETKAFAVAAAIALGG